MPPPASSPFADAVYGRLEPVTTLDEQLNWPLLQLVVGLAKMFEQVEMAAVPIEDRPAWGQVLDPDETPHELHEWMAQFLGVRLIPGHTSAQHIARIKSTDGFKRGTVEALRSAVAATLTGVNPSVEITERVGGNAYRIRVTVQTSALQTSFITETAARAQKAAGLVLELIGTAHTYQDVENTYATYQAVEDDFADYQHLEDNIPI